MIKLYGVKDLVIRCTTKEVEVKVCTNQEAVQFLYSEPCYEFKKVVEYSVEVIENFRKANETILLNWKTRNRDEANKNFQIAVANAKM